MVKSKVLKDIILKGLPIYTCKKKPLLSLPGWVKALRSPTELTTRMMKDAIGGQSLVRFDISGYNLTNSKRFFSTDKCLQFKHKHKQIKKNSIPNFWKLYNLQFQKRKIISLSLKIVSNPVTRWVSTSLNTSSLDGERVRNFYLFSGFQSNYTSLTLTNSSMPNFKIKIIAKKENSQN